MYYCMFTDMFVFVCPALNSFAYTRFYIHFTQVSVTDLCNTDIRRGGLYHACTWIMIDCQPSTIYAKLLLDMSWHFVVSVMPKCRKAVTHRTGLS